MDGRIAKGQQSRRLIMEEAVDLASVDGLAGLSLAGLASRADVSKSGVAALFGTKEQLQIATIAAAREVFTATVVQPALRADPGLDRIRSLIDSWLAYSRGRVFRGGCFFMAASAEFDSRPGPVRDAVLAALQDWHALLGRELQTARDAGELIDADVEQLVFETTAILGGANAWSLLTGSQHPYEAAKRSLTRLFGEW